MGRRREQEDPDRYLQLRGDHFHYRRRVPTEVRGLDDRGQFVRRSLDTRDRSRARTARDLHEAADNGLWAALLLGENPQAAQTRYKLAVKRAESLGFVYR
ncbi:MAG: integrase, partial [Mesorhizobium sp.]